MSANEPIPVYNTLADVFGGVEASLPHAKRWNDLAEQFEQRYGRKPAYIARAPGRVNLIGEHIDYALFGVLPAAIDRDILIACASREAHVAAPSQSRFDHTNATGAVVAGNLQSKYPSQDFAPTLKVTQTEGCSDIEAWFLDIDTTVLRWESYVKAGYYGVLNHFFTDRSKSPVAVDLLVTGSVPAGSGLSSSAALVVASTLAFLAVNGKIRKTAGGLTKGELVELTMVNEKRVGVNSGGMDQAASVMSYPSSALYITFFPSLAASPVPLPPRAVFVVANSLKVADKVLSARHGYNLRVVETLVAARVLANSLRVSVTDERIMLREVVDRYRDVGNNEEELDRVLGFLLESDELDVLKSKAIRSDNFGVTMDEMVEMSGMPKELFHKVYLSSVDIDATHFQLYKRAKHVLSEARRVLQFRKACLSGSDGSVAEKEVLNTLGSLMNDSQESCSTLFECSCPELDDLTRLAKEAGALGSRLTGAGWGGCTISLVSEDKVESFIKQVRERYEPYKDFDDEAFREVVFATKPGRGACVFELE